LKGNDHYDGEESEEKNIKYNWWRFEEFDSETWEKMMDEWREIWLDQYVHESVYEVMKNIENDDDPNYEFVISDDVRKSRVGNLRERLWGPLPPASQKK